MSLLRKFRRQMDRKSQSTPRRKAPVPTRRPRRALLEALEPRILLSADLSFSMSGSTNAGEALDLSIVNLAGVAVDAVLHGMVDLAREARLGTVGQVAAGW